jgi:hypothetical protein
MKCLSWNPGCHQLPLWVQSRKTILFLERKFQQVTIVKLAHFASSANGAKNSSRTCDLVLLAFAEVIVKG